MKPFIQKIIFLALLLCSSAFAEERSPQNFSAEFKGGFWLPQDNTVESFLGRCCNGLIKTEFGYLWRSKFGIEIGVGGLWEKAKALGVTTGGASQDSLSFLFIPVQNNLTFRADFKENQVFVPYIKVGGDYVYYREKVRSSKTQGMKYGMHGTAGLQILMEWFEDLTTEMEGELGINDLYFTLEGQYALIGDSVFGSGLNLSGWTLTSGLLFEF